MAASNCKRCLHFTSTSVPANRLSGFAYIAAQHCRRFASYADVNISRKQFTNHGCCMRGDVGVGRRSVCCGFEGLALSSTFAKEIIFGRGVRS
jgi:hypothetical protein